LSLALRLPPDIPLTLISDSLEPKDDKTWCLWDKRVIPSPDLIHHTWNCLKVIGPDGEAIRSRLSHHAYYCIRSERFQQYGLDKLSNRPQTRLIEARVNEIEPGKNTAVLHHTSGSTHADLVFQSHRPPPNTHLYSEQRIALKQHFQGWDIKTVQPVFDPDEAILMDFRVNQSLGFAFVYVLPFSTTEALVELTFFTPDLLDNRATYSNLLTTYLSTQFQLEPDSYSIKRTEFGVIPMVDGFVPSPSEHPIYSIGLAGGHAKASTGYAFSRIMRDSMRIGAELSRGVIPGRGSLSEIRYQFYDLLILQLIKNEPDRAVDIFTTLFRKNGFDTMFRFLDEQTSFSEDLQIMASVPRYSDFFRSMWRTRHRLASLSVRG